MSLSLAGLAAAMVMCAHAICVKGDETINRVNCRVIENAARTNQISVVLLTRLLWQESRFQIGSISRAGAEGVAQFMPETSFERGLSDPFDPDQAIPKAAKLLADLDRRFENIGLAVAAYNAGPGRIANWLSGAGPIPRETRLFVISVTGRSLEEWAYSAQYPNGETAQRRRSCVELKASLGKLPFNEKGGLVVGEDTSRMLRGLERSGRMLPGMEESGRILPGMEESGRILPGMEATGRTLPELSDHHPP